MTECLEVRVQERLIVSIWTSTTTEFHLYIYDLFLKQLGPTTAHKSIGEILWFKFFYKSDIIPL